MILITSKNVRWVHVFFLLVLNSISFAEEFRTFADSSGREVQGKILKVDSRRGKVTILRNNSSQATVSIAAFSIKDQDYILEWARYQPLLSPTYLKIDLNRKTGNRPDNLGALEPNSPYIIEGLETVYYELKLTNRSDMALPNFTCEYRINGRGCVKGINVKKRTEPFTFHAKEQTEIKTEEVALYKQVHVTMDGDDLKYRTFSKDEITEFRININLKTPKGNVFTREEIISD